MAFGPTLLHVLAASRQVKNPQFYTVSDSPLPAQKYRHCSPLAEQCYRHYSPRKFTASSQIPAISSPIRQKNIVGTRPRNQVAGLE